MYIWTATPLIIILISWIFPVVSVTNRRYHAVTKNNISLMSASGKNKDVKYAKEALSGSTVNFYEEDLHEEARKKKKKPDIMTRILPMMIIPFLLQTFIIPMMLTSLKVMLIKSAFIGKMAILLGFINMLRVSFNRGGVYTHNVQLGHSKFNDHLAEQHYGYKGEAELGAWINRRKRTAR